jgi:superfamily I DNA/RNA helicase
VASADAGVTVAVERVAEWVKEPEIVGGAICVMAPSKKLRDAVGEQLASAGIAVSTIEVDAADIASPDAVRVATMHRAKGLEFDRVVVLAPNGVEPAGGTDIAQLIYVSLTRAKTGAVLVR